VANINRHDAGPRRSQSVDAYLRRTRVLAVVALLALAGAITSDSVRARFWTRHSLLAGLVASLIVVMLSGAILNEVLERRRRQRWSVLAQYVMLELVRNARLIWTGVLEHARLVSPDSSGPDAVEANARIVQDTPRLRAALGEVIGDRERLHGLNDEIAVLAVHTDQVLGRWAAVMLSTDLYAEVIDRHVELASDVSWLNGLLDTSDPPEDKHRHRLARSSPAVQIEGAISGETLVDRVVVITQLAQQLDRGTLELALRIVPVTWWKARLGATLPAERPAGP
jgi:hypothetical protein